MNQIDKNYEGVYVAFKITPSLDLITIQEYICEQQQLNPRPEFHITFGFFDKIKPSLVESIGNLMIPFIHEEFESVTINGIGGAYQDINKKPHYIKSHLTSYINYPRVFWLSVFCSNSMIEFRNNLISNSISLGLPLNYLRPTFFPHITLGSNGPKNSDSDWALWDLHGIEKKSSIEYDFYPKTLKVDAIHLTSVSVHPNGLFTIKKF